MVIKQTPAQPASRRGTQPWARRLRNLVVGLVAVTALSLSAAGTAFALHDTEPAGFHPPGAPGHDHPAGFHPPGQPGHGH